MKQRLLDVVDRHDLYPFFNRWTRDTATIFMMHRFGASDEHEGVFSQNRLRYCFNYLRDGGYRVVSLSRYVQALSNHLPTRKTVVFTVDDGYRDFYEIAYPLFREYGIPGTVFLTSDFVEGRLFFWWDRIRFAVEKTRKKVIDLPEHGMHRMRVANVQEKELAISEITQACKTLTNTDKLLRIDALSKHLNVGTDGQPTGPYAALRWEEILEMQENEIEFHPHTRTHPIMTSIPRNQKQEEVQESKRVLEDKLGRTANIFCYPNGGPGDFDEETISVLKECGYVAAVTGISGFDGTRRKTDPFRLRRYHIPDEAVLFKQYVCGLEALKRSVLRKVSARYK